MTHDSYRELIQRELDEDLSPEETVVLEAHLISCADCRRERAEYQMIALGLSKLSKVVPERSFVSQITPDLLEQAQPHTPAPTPVPTPVPIRRKITPAWWRGLSVAAVVVLAVGFSTNWHLGLNQPKTSPTKMAAVPDQKTQPPATDAASTQPVAEAPVGTPAVLPPTTPAPAAKVAMTQSQTTPPVAAVPPSATTQTTTASLDAIKATDSHVVANAGQQTGKTIKSGSGNGLAPTDTSSNKDVHPSGDNINSGEKVPANVGPVISGGDTMGMAATRVITVGPTPVFPDVINVQLQQQVDRGDESAVWATDPYAVVQHFLPDLGFASTAIEMTTVDASRMHLMQNGVLYEVQLEQPFDQGTTGIWRPTRIGRGISEKSPAGYEKVILQYFNDLVVNGTLSNRQEVFIVSHLEDGNISVTLNEEQTASNGEKSWNDVLYELTLDQDTSGEWSVKNVQRIG